MLVASSFERSVVEELNYQSRGENVKVEGGMSPLNSVSQTL